VERLNALVRAFVPSKRPYFIIDFSGTTSEVRKASGSTKKSTAGSLKMTSYNDRFGRLDDERWLAVKDLFLNREGGPKRRGRKPIDNRILLDAILLAIREDRTWRSLPSSFHFLAFKLAIAHTSGGFMVEFWRRPFTGFTL